MLRAIAALIIVVGVAISMARAADGDAVPPSLKTLFTLAEQGNAVAQNDLGVMYQAGTGVPQNFAEAIKWLRKSADQGFSTGQYNLGARYALGEGVPKDDAEALKWYRLAAAQGHGASLYNIAVAYINAQAVPRDYLLAAVYFDLASTSDLSADATAQAIANRDRILTNLGALQKRRVEVLAQQCRSTHFKTCEGLADARDNRTAAGDAPQAGMPGVRSTGTGFFVNADGYVLTNAHVIAGCPSVKSSSGGTLQTTAVDGANDLAILKSSAKSPQFARFKEGGSRPGETVVAVGYPYAAYLSSSATVTTGVIAALSGLRGDQRIMRMTAPVQHGNSGGPLLGPTGAVVGVVNGAVIPNEMTRATNDIPQNINFAIVVDVVRAFLDANHIAYERDSGKTERKAPDIAEDALKYTVLLECAP